MSKGLSIGETLPDFELPDQDGVKRRLSKMQGTDAMVLLLGRGEHCPRERQHQREMIRFHRWCAVAYTTLVTVLPNDLHDVFKLRASTGAFWAYLSDTDLDVQRALQIDEYTDTHHAATVPHTLVLAPGLVIDKVYVGYWFWGRPSPEQLWSDLADLHRRIKPDFDHGAGTGGVGGLNATSWRRHHRVADRVLFTARTDGGKSVTVIARYGSTPGTADHRVGGRVSEPGTTASDRELADHYDRARVRNEEWGEPETVTRRLDVTLSVRFSSAEIATIRSRAVAAGLKPTAYIGQCALAAEQAPIDRARLARSVDALSRDLEDLRRAASCSCLRRVFASHGLQCRVEHVRRQGRVECRLGVDDRRPRRRLVEIGEQRPSPPQDQPHEGWVELGPAATPSHLDRGVDTAGAVEHRKNVGKVDDPGRDRDLVGCCPDGAPLPSHLSNVCDTAFRTCCERPSSFAN